MTCNVTNKQRKITEKVHLYVHSPFWKSKARRLTCKLVYRKWRLTASRNLFLTDEFIYTLASTKYGIKIMTLRDGILIYIQTENLKEFKK